ncbi:hypothetical protein NECAME_15266 [Necator americanus]|uniref:Uncharacterized protein n=1 Tax=Necator americanus TaxID=51031 RepID=W2SIS8_NECAM|nr:hypothetical protein NECAME_15266 [Necator americanus]ETN69495.1 hypothetical protein NECAME_15266 [Necator americanus]
MSALCAFTSEGPILYRRILQRMALQLFESLDGLPERRFFTLEFFLLLIRYQEVRTGQGLYRFLIFGDDRKFMRWIAEDLELDEHKNRRFIASISTFSEGVDFYVSSQACAAFFMSAPISTFGWWLAFFTPNQSAVYYMDDKRPMKDKVPSKDLFL